MAVPARADYLGALKSELELAEGYGDTRRAAELRAQINQFSAMGSAGNPSRETASRQPGRAARRKT